MRPEILIRLTAFLVAALVVLLIPGDNATSLVGAGAAVAVALVAAVVAQHLAGTPLPVRVSAGPPLGAQRRRRGNYLRQSHPDTAGRVRARAPGHHFA